MKHESEYIPSCIDELIWTPFEEDGRWYNQWSGFGCEDGEILDVCCDADGNWDIEGSGYDSTPGNWERMNEELLRDSERAAKNYHDFCRETGTDPLHALYIERTKTVREHWVALFTLWIGAATHGLAVTQVGRGRKTCLDPQQAPKYVRDYLGLVKVGNRWCMDGVHSAKDMINAGYVGNGYVKFTVERKVPMSAKKIAGQVRRILQP